MLDKKVGPRSLNSRLGLHIRLTSRIIIKTSSSPDASLTVLVYGLAGETRDIVPGEKFKKYQKLPRGLLFRASVVACYRVTASC